MLKKSVGEVIKKKAVTLDKDKLEAQKGIKITKPLEVTVSLECDMGALYSVYIEGSPLIPRRRLVGLGDLERVSDRYKKIIRELREGNYTLESAFEIKVSIGY